MTMTKHAVSAALLRLLVLLAVATATTAQSAEGELCEGKTKALTEIDFFIANLIENTLHEEGRLRYEGVGLLRDRDLDLVVTRNADSKPYSTFRVGKNGYNCIDYPEGSCKNFGNIHVETIDPENKTVTAEDKAKMDGKATFDFCFMYKGTEEKATVDSFDWSVFDLDYRKGGGLQERFIMDTSQAVSYSLSKNSEIKMWCEDDGPETAKKSGKFQYKYTDYTDNEKNKTRNGPHYLPPGTCNGNTVFHSTYYGRTEDNPTNPKDMTDIALARSIEFRFENTACWTFSYWHYCPCGNYCDEKGGLKDDGGEIAETCKLPNNNGNGPGRCREDGHCKKYTGGQFLFASKADPKITEDGECVTSPPVPAPTPSPTVEGSLTDCTGEIITSDSYTDINIHDSEVIVNTLHKEGGELRYGDVGKVRDEEVDLVVTVYGGEYTDLIEDVWDERGKDKTTMNGKRYNSTFAKINLQTIRGQPNSGRGDFQFCFVKAGTQETVKVDTFHWSVFDLDQRGNDITDDGVGVKEKMMMDVSQAKLYQLWPDTEGSEIKLSCEDGSDVPCENGVRTVFHSTTWGTSDDNPHDPHNMTDQQKERSVTFTFKDTDCWRFSFDHYSILDQPDDVFPAYGPNVPSFPVYKEGEKLFPRGGYYEGGNFLFSGAAKEMITDGECITPPPTIAPTRVPVTDDPTYAPVAESITEPPVAESRTAEPTGTDAPVAESITEPPVEIPVNECPDDVIPKKIFGATILPRGIDIVSQDESTVTVSLRQAWTDDTVDHIFAVYRPDSFNLKCVENADIPKGVFETLTIQCNIMKPKAYLEVCVVDSLAKGLLDEEDDAEVPQCCYPTFPPGSGVVCYSLEINCISECVEELASRQLRGGAERRLKGE